MVIRPSEEKILFRTAEQWHWFDCPMQLGTNSVDTPRKDAVLSQVVLQEDDLVLAVSDGVMDNLWEHEVLKIVLDSLQKWDQGIVETEDVDPPPDLSNDRMVYVARELLNAALTIAQDPFAESPYMEKAVDEGLAIEGGMYPDPLYFEVLTHSDMRQAKWTTSLLWLHPAINAVHKWCFRAGQNSAGIVTVSIHIFSRGSRSSHPSFEDPTPCYLLQQTTLHEAVIWSGSKTNFPQTCSHAIPKSMAPCAKDELLFVSGTSPPAHDRWGTSRSHNQHTVYGVYSFQAIPQGHDFHDSLRFDTICINDGG